MTHDFLGDLFRFGARSVVAMTSGAKTIVTSADYTARVIKLTGVLAGNGTVCELPLKDGADWVIWNACTGGGGYIVTVQGASGAGVSTAQGSVTYVATDGASFRKSDSFDPASPGAIGGTTPAPGTFTTLTGNSLSLATGGYSFATANTSPVVTQSAKAAISTAQGGATQAWTAQDATAGSVTAGAADGGGFAWTTGAAKRLTSGNANGGDSTFSFGAGIGTGRSGMMIVNGFLSVGGGTPATTGVIRFPKPSEQATLLSFNINAGGTDVVLLGTNTSNEMLLGDATNVASMYLRSAGGIGTISSNLHLRQTDQTLRLTFTPAAAALLNVAASTSLDIQTNGTSRIKVDGTGIGFFAATPVAKPAPSGSRAGNAALASLLTALANLGLIQDGTSA